MPKRHSEFINHLNKLLEVMTSAWLSKLIGVADSRIPEWRRGLRLPSPDTLIKLGKVALEQKLDDPFFFWALAGVDTETLLVMADKVQERRYELTGPTVPIPRFRATEQSREDAGSPIPLPTEFIPNPAATICLVKDNESTGIVDAPRGLIILDTSVEGIENLSDLWEQVVALYFTPRFPSSVEPNGIYVGRLDLYPGGFPTMPHAAVLRARLISLHETRLALADIGYYVEEEGLAGIAGDDLAALTQRWAEVRARAASKFRFPKGTKIVGKVIGRLTGHLHGPRDGGK